MAFEVVEFWLFRVQNKLASWVSMMEKASYLFMSMLLLLLPFPSALSYQILLPLPHQPNTRPITPVPQLRCRDDEMSALLEFKGSIRSNKWCLDSWKMEGDAGNCCSWEGVTCGGPSGHVTGLILSNCSLFGFFNSSSSIFRLVHLQVLNLDHNDFNHSSMPSALGNLRYLRELTVSTSNFYGPIPPSLSNLTQLVTLDLSFNSFQGPIFPLLSNLMRLETLSLGGNQFTGDIPPSITNLIRLTSLSLYKNQFTGEIPHQIGTLTHLQSLDISYNRFHGQIPTSLSALRNLTFLRLGPNNFSGTVHFDMFSGMELLKDLTLSFSNISVAIGSTESYHLQNIKNLSLAQCNLKEFPAFTEKLSNLAYLDLSHNNLSGEVPGQFLEANAQTLRYLNLKGNSLTGFSRDLYSYNLTRLAILDLSFNMLQGSLPIPTSPPNVYLASNNMLSGEIPREICNWEACYEHFMDLSNFNFTNDPPQCLILLDLSKNNFTGEIPRCLSNFSKSLKMLTLHSNNFSGRIPPFNSRKVGKSPEILFPLGSNFSGRIPPLGSGSCALEMIDLSNNQLQGPLPRSLANCSKLRFLNVGNNRMDDDFPSWLGSLSSLSVLILRSNYFRGELEKPKIDPVFPKLQIIDASDNNFEGSLPSFYFQNWRYMGESDPRDLFYLNTSILVFEYNMCEFQMTITNKGVETEYTKILGYLKVVDLSSNNFTGEIPDSIASLHGVHLLNLSNNLLTGSIPPSLGALTQLGALDLSRNELTGEIPRQLAQIPFLSIFNVSYNNLSGPIPQGKQFGSFPNSSYWGNSGLCGDTLSRKCGNSGPQPPPSPKSTEKDEGSDVPFEIEWRAVAVGYAVMFIIAAVIGHKMITNHGNWFASALGLRQLRSRR